MKGFINNRRKWWLAGPLLISISAFAELPKKKLAPLEMNCSVSTSGQALECFKAVGKEKKAMSDQDLIEFVNNAQRGAYLNIKSRKGHERVFFLDPNSPELAELYSKSKILPAREYGKAKFDMFGTIESRLVKLSEDLDSANSAPSLIRSDLSYAQEMYRLDLRNLTFERDQARSCCEKNRDQNAEQRLEATIQEKNYVSHYLSMLVKTMTEPGYCTDSFKLNPGDDQSIGLDQVNSLSTTFKEKCKKVVEQKPSATPIPTSPPPVASKNEALHILRDKWGKKKFDQVRGYTCAKTFAEGPFIISGSSEHDRPVCLGNLECSKPDTGPGRQKKGRHSKEDDSLHVTTVCAATVTSNGLFVCPPANECLQDQEFLILKEGVIVK